MRIAQFAPLAESVPPIGYGGIERAVSYLTEELVRLGHDVVLFASNDSLTKAKLVPCCPRALRTCSGVPQTRPSGDLSLFYHWHSEQQLDLLQGMRADLEEFDVLHFHTDLFRFPLFRQLKGRAITTLHMPGGPSGHFGEFFKVCPDAPVVSVSDSQRLTAPNANWIATIHVGLPANSLRLSHRPSGDYLAFLGRISPEKGPDRAIEIARRAEIPLKIAGKIGDDDRTYFEKRIRPFIDGKTIEFLGEIDSKAKCEILGQARALLFPVRWPEPFGLVMIEAIACGTPVIGFNCGAVAELVDHGTTGFVVRDIRAGVRAVRRVEQLNRTVVQETFRRRFTVERMAEQYLDIYSRLERTYL